MEAYRTVRKLLAVAMAVAMVSSIAVAPALADDEISIGTDGVSVGGDDGIGISIGDEENGGSVSVDGSTADQEVNVEASGGAGGSGGSVDCELSTDASGVPCETNSGGGGSGLPVNPGDGLPADPSLPGGGSGLPAAPDLPGGGDGGSGLPDAPSLPDGGDGGNGLPGGGAPVIDPGLPNGGSGSSFTPIVATPAGPVRLIVIPGGRAVDQAGVDFFGSGSDQIDHATLLVGPNDGTTTIDVLGGAQDRQAGTIVECNAGGGVLSVCTVTNTAPVSFSDVPHEDLPAFPDGSPVSWGLIALAFDSTVQQPQALIGLGAQQIGANTPEQSPLSINNPPYNPDDPPIDPTQPEESIDPGISQMENGGSAMIYGANLRLNDRVSGSGGVGVDQGSSAASVAGTASDGQNSYSGVVVVSPNGVMVFKSGHLSGSMILGPDNQDASGELDLGGQPYALPPESGGGGGGGAPSAPSLPGGGGSVPSLPGGGSLPANPAQPPELPAGELPVSSVPLPADPSVPV